MPLFAHREDDSASIEEIDTLTNGKITTAQYGFTVPDGQKIQMNWSDARCFYIAGGRNRPHKVWDYIGGINQQYSFLEKNNQNLEELANPWLADKKDAALRAADIAGAGGASGSRTVLSAVTEASFVSGSLNICVPYRVPLCMPLQ